MVFRDPFRVFRVDAARAFEDVRHDAECIEDLHRLGRHAAARAARELAPCRFVLVLPGSSSLPPATSATAHLLASMPEVQP